MSDTLRVAGPYTDGQFSVLSTGPQGKAICHGFYKSKGLADARLFQLRDERGGSVRR